MAKAKKKNSAFLSRLAMGFIFALAVIYTLYHVISLFAGDNIKTIVSGVTTHSVTVGGTGYIFRDETLLTMDNTGVVDYLVADGEKVSLNQNIANVYEGGDGDMRELVLKLDRQIALLEESSLGSEPLDLSSLRKEANDTYYKLVELLATDSTGELSAYIESMMIVLNRISVATNGEMSIEETLETLKRARESIFGGEYDSAYAQASGYFYYSPDGYEKAFTFSAVDELSEESFYKLVESIGEGSELSPRVFGKFAKTSSWRLVLPLSYDDAQNFADGDSCSLTFPENNGTKLNMTLEKKVMAKKNKQMLCVFYCNRLPENFSFDRAQNVEVELSSASGIYVPRSALKRVDGVRGVYVLRGSVVHFRSVDVIYEDDDYCLIDENSKDVGEYYALGTNELIITEGKNLFHGRILD